MARDFDLSGYNTVPERIAEFRDKYPDGRLRAVNPARPFWIEDVDGHLFVCYAAEALRTADDPNPGIGCAWEPFPGRTPYTRDSELQNAETSAWGRAIVATLAADTQKGIVSREEVRNRRADETEGEPRPTDVQMTKVQELKRLLAGTDLGEDDRQAGKRVWGDVLGRFPKLPRTAEDAEKLLTGLAQVLGDTEDEPF
jgi:hypothetical protein